MHFIGGVNQNDPWHVEAWGEERHRYWFMLKPASKDDIDKLVWASLSEDIDIQPRIEAPDIYLVDIERQIVQHIYDDRGMDVVANDLDMLEPFYERFNDWIFDDDRSQIDTVFETREPIKMSTPEGEAFMKQSAPPWVKGPDLFPRR